MRARGFGLIAVSALTLGLGASSTAGAGDLTFMVDGGLRTMSNSPETQKAIFGSKKGIGFGGGVFLDRGPRWRFGIEARIVDRKGERAFAADRSSEAFRLGHPLTFTMTGGVASGTFRFKRFGPVAPYVGVGAGFVSWKEKSDIAGLVERASGTAGLFEGRLGFERQSGRLVYALEGGITFVPSAVGVGGISQVYEESDLGGVFVVARLGFSKR